MTTTKLVVGGSLAEDAAAFVSAWHRAEKGAKVREHVLSFESWEGLARVMTGERYRLLRHLHAQPQPSVSALARGLARPYRRVHEDVKVLEEAGLIMRDGGMVRAIAGVITAEVRLAA